jgi:hypothetical protein
MAHNRACETSPAKPGETLDMIFGDVAVDEFSSARDATTNRLAFE